MPPASTTLEAAATQLVDTHLIHPNPYNAQGRDTGPEFEALKANIAEKGLLQAIVLRPHPEIPGAYQIAAGESRWAAHKALRIASIPATIRSMTDQDLMEIALAENFLRKPLTHWQEAQAFKVYLDQGYDVKGIAAQTGRSETLIRRRALLLQLSPTWQKAVASKDKRFEKWTPLMFERIARYPEHIQDNLLKNEFKRWAPDDMEELERALSEEMQEIKNAPWKADDATLVPAAGSCNACPKRTGAQADLFGDVDGQAKAGDRCLDGACWAGKMKAHLALQVTTAKKDNPGKKVAQITTEQWSNHTPKGVQKPDDYQLAKKDDPKAQPAVVVEGEGLGKTVYIKPRERGNHRPVNIGKTTKDGEPQGKSMKEKRAALEKRRNVLAFGKLVELIEKGERIRRLPASEVLLLAAAFGTEHNAENTWYTGKADPWKTKEKLERFTQVELVGALWKEVAGVIIQRIQHGAAVREIKAREVNEASAVCSLLGLSWPAIKADADAEIPEPKSWAAAGKVEKKADGKKPKAKKRAKPATSGRADDIDDLASDPDIDGENDLVDEGDLD